MIHVTVKWGSIVLSGAWTVYSNNIAEKYVAAFDGYLYLGN
jgi:hypothetical protein